MAKKKKKRIVSIPSKNLNRYNSIQKILSAYSKETGVKFGKKFSKIASELNKKTKDYPLKFIEQNVDQLYADLFKKKEEKGRFPSDFKFYKLEETLSLPKFDGVKVSYYFKDSSGEYSASGTSDEVIDEYKLSLYRHLRNNYDGYTDFVLDDTDNKTFVKYKVDVKEEQIPATPPKPTGTGSGANKTKNVGSNLTAKELIAVEKEKQKTLALEMKKIDKILSLLKQGYTKEEINKLFGL
jgi:hypothetical protein